MSDPGTVTALALAVGGAGIVIATGQGTRSGALAGLAVAVLATLGLGPGALLPLAIFVLGAGALTRWGRARKEAIGSAEANRGRRGVRHVLAKLGLPALLGAAALLGAGLPWLPLAYAAAIAAAMADTAATETGPLMGGAVVRIRGAGLERVPHGSVGGVSVAGVGAAACGALLIGWSSAISGLLHGGAQTAVAAAAGFTATMMESLLAGNPIGMRLGHHGRNALVSLAAAVLAAGASAWGWVRT